MNVTVELIQNSEQVQVFRWWQNEKCESVFWI